MPIIILGESEVPPQPALISSEKRSAVASGRPIRLRRQPKSLENFQLDLSGGAIVTNDPDADGVQKKRRVAIEKSELLLLFVYLTLVLSCSDSKHALCFVSRLQN